MIALGAKCSRWTSTSTSGSRPSSSAAYLLANAVRSGQPLRGGAQTPSLMSTCSSLETTLAPRMPPTRFPPPGPSSSPALAPSTKTSSPRDQRSEESTRGRPPTVGAPSSSSTERNRADDVSGSGATPVQRTTRSKSSPLTWTLSAVEVQTPRSTASSTSMRRELPGEAASRCSSSRYGAGTLPPAVASRIACSRLVGGRQRYSKRSRSACLTSSQPTAMSKGRLCSGRRDRSTTRCPAREAVSAACAAEMPPPITSTEAGPPSPPLRLATSSRKVPLPWVSSCSEWSTRPQADEAAESSGAKGGGMLHAPTGPVARISAAASTSRSSCGSPAALYCTRKEEPPPPPPPPALATRVAVPRSHLCGSSASSEAQKSRKRALDGSALSSDAPLESACSGRWSVVGIHCTATGAASSSAVLPSRIANSTSAVGSKAEGWTYAGERSRSISSARKRPYHASRKCEPGSITATVPRTGLLPSPPTSAARAAKA
mmetsp:Transcript_33131/g.108319  ORF Transcript_33131/g.108319 Transcript_33131/m.108319 type:complete len:488 (-) Transcript_33131:169-1632(-)